jgi:hypothetical protein
MRQLSSRMASVVLAAALVVAGLEFTSYAANGHPFVLGGSNTESRTASLTNTGKGPALSLGTGKHQPPLAVTSKRMVKNLNADAVDGLEAKALQAHAIRYVVPAGTHHLFALKGVKPGGYLASFSIGMDSDTTSRCTLEDKVSGDYLATDSDSSDGVYVMTSASAVIRVPAGSGLLIACEADISSASFLTNTVGLVRLRTVSQGSTSPARTAASQR